MSLPGQTGRGRHYDFYWSIHLFVHIFIFSFFCYQTCDYDILKTRASFDANWSMGQEHETINFGGPEVKDQDHMMLKIDLGRVAQT